MRILHTSDWHLGQNFYGKSRASEHRQFFDWLLEQVKDHNVDAVIVAGDIFDTGAPPSYARELYNDVFPSLKDLGCETVVLAGNHDSVAVLNESRELLKRLQIHVITAASDEGGDQIITLKNHRGEPGAIVCAIPFIRPRDIMLSSAGQSGSEKQQALQQAIGEHYESLFALAEKQNEASSPKLPIVATGHLTTVGASTSDSVRDIYIGTLEAFPAQAFPPADYVALGHIHRPQKVGNQEHIQYSGSPIHLSFDELPQAKTVNLVTFSDGDLKSVERIEVPAFQPMQVLKGSIEDIEAQLKQIATEQDGQNVWLDIEVLSEEFVSDLQSRIRKMAESLPVEILLLRRKKEVSAAGLEKLEGESLSELSPSEVFDRRLQLEPSNDDSSQSRQKRIKASYHQILNELTLQHSDTVDTSDSEPQQGSLL